MKNILIFGGTGFIGKHLTKLLKDDYNITILSRNPGKQKDIEGGHISLETVDYDRPERLEPLLRQADAVINLAGANVGVPWNNKNRALIRNSRLKADQALVEAFNACSHKPAVVIQGSGMGVYGTSASEDEFTESSPLATEGFLTETGIAHERALATLEDKTRVVYLRTGLVLDANEGALPKMAMPFKLFLGGPTGSGKQWTSWIHIADEVGAIRFLMEHQELSGPFNLTAPEPVRNADFSKALGKSLHRPSAISTPAFILKLMMGEMADELLLGGRKILPEKLLKAGFHFQYPEINAALKNIYSFS